MRCDNCGRGDLWVVHFSTVGSTTFAYCRHCEHKRWEAAGAELELGEVLRSAGTIEPAKPRR
ncbi:MAG: hypothetical protein ACRDKJ_08340 [Actinomycetota bacterium]